MRVRLFIICKIACDKFDLLHAVVIIIEPREILLLLEKFSNLVSCNPKIDEPLQLIQAIIPPTTVAFANHVCNYDVLKYPSKNIKIFKISKFTVYQSHKKATSTVPRHINLPLIPTLSYNSCTSYDKSIKVSRYLWAVVYTLAHTCTYTRT